MMSVQKASEGSCAAWIPQKGILESNKCDLIGR